MVNNAASKENSFARAKERLESLYQAVAEHFPQAFIGKLREILTSTKVIAGVVLLVGGIGLLSIAAPETFDQASSTVQEGLYQQLGIYPDENSTACDVDDVLLGTNVFDGAEVKKDSFTYMALKEFGVVSECDDTNKNNPE